MGISGGMCPQGITLIHRHWLDAALIMERLGAVFWFAIAARRPPGLNLRQYIQGLPFDATGQQSTEFDAVSVAIMPELADTVLW